MALNISMAPVTSSHSSSYTHRLYPQDDPDRVFLAIKANGRETIITFYPEYRSCESLADTSIW